MQKQPFGQLEKQSVEDYRNFLGNLKDRGAQIMLTLHHFANPLWFDKSGSWSGKESPKIFSDYTGKIANELGDLVDSWNTINEPTTYVFNGYLLGMIPPFKRNLQSAISTMRMQKEAHKQAYNKIKEVHPEKPVGISNAVMDFHPDSELGRLTSKLAQKVYCDFIPDLFTPQDFIGLSYYGRVPFNPLPVSEINTPGKLSKMGKEHDKMWEYYPEGLEKAIDYFYKKHGKPIIITENGCCTDDDTLRERSILAHLSATHRAIENGSDVKGYFHWSTFDNYEHNLGKNYRFGLVDVDYKTMKRTMKPSGILYSTIAKENAIDVVNYRGLKPLSV